jgi:hypothetical protein
MSGQLRWLRHSGHLAKYTSWWCASAAPSGWCAWPSYCTVISPVHPTTNETTVIRHQILKLARILDGIEDDLQFGSHGDSHEGRLRAATGRKGPQHSKFLLCDELADFRFCHVQGFPKRATWSQLHLRGGALLGATIGGNHLCLFARTINAASAAVF